MKNFAKLALVFSICFVTVFSVALFIKYISSWVEIARIIPVGERASLNSAEMAWKTLPVAVYLSILIGLSYSARKKMAAAGSIISVIILASIFTSGLVLGIEKIGDMGSTLAPVSPIRSGPGLVLSRSGSSTILLTESTSVQGPRIVSFPEQPLIYQEIPLGPGNTIIPLPPLHLGAETPWFIYSMEIDLNINGTEMMNRFREDRLHFAFYAFSLILLLASMHFILGLSHWPLANIFLGALVFRGLLALEVFLNSREINSLIGSFLGERIPPVMITPIVLGAIGILSMLYSILARMARPKRSLQNA